MVGALCDVLLTAERHFLIKVCLINSASKETRTQSTGNEIQSTGNVLVTREVHGTQAVDSGKPSKKQSKRLGNAQPFAKCGAVRPGHNLQNEKGTGY